jgi:hypothetical protein
MRHLFADRRRRPFLIAGIIVLVGLCAGVVIFVTAGGVAGVIPEFSPDYSKSFRHDLELYGGSNNVLANQFMTWFDSLWHGQRLAFTVVAISVLVALGYVFFAVELPPLPDDKPPDDAPRLP